MATLTWVGTTDAVAQISTATPANVNIGDTFKLTIGGETVSFVATADNVANACAGLVAAFQASTHPYFRAITATDSTTTVTLTAIVLGVPFTCTSSIIDGAGGAAPTLTMATPTVNVGPNVLTTPGNWDTGAIPVNNDHVVFTGDTPNVCWELDGLTGVTIDSITVEQSYTGRIGLNSRRFATSANGKS